MKAHYRKPIPMMHWTPDLVKLLADLKLCITSSPVLARFDPGKTTFFKTGWSSEDMGWILMQPANDKESIAASEKLTTTGKCSFNLSKNIACLKPIAFGSRGCQDNERNLHSFTGDGVYECWSIGKNLKCLWGCHFYWMCNCSAMKEF